MKGLPEKMGLPEKQQSEHLSADAELSALLETLDALERQAKAGPWSLEVELDGADDEKYGTICIAQINRNLHDSEWAARDDWDADLANGEFIVALRNAYPLLRERLSAALLDNQRVRKEREELQKRLDHLAPAERAPSSSVLLIRPAGAAHVHTPTCSYDRSSSVAEDRYVCTCGWRDVINTIDPEPLV